MKMHNYLTINLLMATGAVGLHASEEVKTKKITPEEEAAFYLNRPKRLEAEQRLAEDKAIIFDSNASLEDRKAALQRAYPNAHAIHITTEKLAAEASEKDIEWRTGKNLQAAFDSVILRTTAEFSGINPKELLAQNKAIATVTTTTTETTTASTTTTSTEASAGTNTKETNTTDKNNCTIL